LLAVNVESNKKELSEAGDRQEIFKAIEIK